MNKLMVLLVLLTVLAVPVLARHPSASEKSARGASRRAETDLVAQAKSRPGSGVEARYPALAGKMDRQLLHVLDTVRSGRQQLGRLKGAGGHPLLSGAGDEVSLLVTLDAKASVSGVAARLRQQGGAVVHTGEGVVKVSLPMDRIHEAAMLQGVERIRMPRPPRTKNTVVSEGVSESQAHLWQGAGFRGAGVKVAVIDSSFSNIAALKARGELPVTAVEVNLTAGSMTAGVGVHGSACAEIVHDMAPDAQLYLIKIDDVTDFLAAVNYCIGEGVDIISCSLGYDALNFHDGFAYATHWTTAANHPVAAVNAAQAAGILWVNAAGNEQRQHSLLTWRDGDSNSFLDWSASQNDLNVLWVDGSTTLRVGTYINVYLTWNQWPVTDQDFDLHLYRHTGSGWERVESGFLYGADGLDWQLGTAGSYPYEEIFYEVRQQGQYAVAVRQFSGTSAPDFILRYYAFGAGRDIEPQYFSYNDFTTVPPGSLCIPADAEAALTAGALDHLNYTSGPIESFSSLGPNNAAYSGGVAVMKPDLCGANGTASGSYSGDFFGTSAATPHVAGLAALVKGRYPDLTPSQLREYLARKAHDLGSVGPDNTYGAGAAMVHAQVLWDDEHTELGGGWRRLNWFGDYIPTGGGWFWHNRHGYFAPSALSVPEQVYMYTMDMGWLFTRHTRYPYLYRFGDQCWLWYLPDSRNPRWFNNMTHGLWETW